jgi:hypothetical protein
MIIEDQKEFERRINEFDIAYDYYRCAIEDGRILTDSEKMMIINSTRDALYVSYDRRPNEVDRKLYELLKEGVIDFREHLGLRKSDAVINHLCENPESVQGSFSKPFTNWMAVNLGNDSLVLMMDYQL